MTNLINHLKQLDKDATPRPWKENTEQSAIGAPLIINPEREIALVKYWMGSEDNEVHHNSRLIMEMRNRLPEIISLLEAGEKLRGEINYVANTSFAWEKYPDLLRAAGHYDTIKKELE